MTRKMDNKFFIYLKSIITVIVFTNPPCGFSRAGICRNGCRTIIFLLRQCGPVLPGYGQLCYFYNN